MVQKEERIHAQLKAYEEQQVEIKKMEDFIQKNIARASTTKRAQSRRKTLEKMERLEKPLIQNKQAAIRFDTAVSSGKQVLEVKDLSVGYEKPLLKNLSVRLERGEHVAIIGPNGIGKSTLLKTLVGHLPSLDGEMKWGVQVQMDYYDQEQKELNPEKQVIDEIWDYHPHLDQTTIRSYLGQFLFSGEDVFKKVSDLSGGEKARLSLLKRLLNQANFLLMDEPTNHLDMFSKERLEQALENFPGTLLFISHDRYFINRLANRVWEISSEGIKDYPGSYEWYLEKKALEKLEETTGVPEEEATHSSAQTYRQQEKELRRQQKKQQQKIMELEKDIIEIEERIAEIHELLCNPDLFSDPLKSSELKQELEQLENKLTLKTDEWAELADT
jgi:ATP-binding cassette subfamily F protein 3